MYVHVISRSREHGKQPNYTHTHLSHPSHRRPLLDAKEERGRRRGIRRTTYICSWEFRITKTKAGEVRSQSGFFSDASSQICWCETSFVVYVNLFCRSWRTWQTTPTYLMHPWHRRLLLDARGSLVRERKKDTSVGWHQFMRWETWTFA